MNTCSENGAKMSLVIVVILLIHPPIDIGGSLNETTAFYESWQNIQFRAICSFTE
ncbi:MAG: hypothetical protein ACRCUY_13750 [Thermoguttaceae bacterium]